MRYQCHCKVYFTNVHDIVAILRIWAHHTGSIPAFMELLNAGLAAPSQTGAASEVLEWLLADVCTGPLVSGRTYSQQPEKLSTDPGYIPLNL